MKKIHPVFMSSIFVFILSNVCYSQNDFPKDCSTLYVDLQEGTLNGLPPTISQNEVKEAFTCFTGSTDDGATINCGGGVFFLDHDFYFYTYRDYIEIRTNFSRNSVSDNILGADMDAVEKKFGKPKKKYDMDTFLYEMKYGTLRIEFSEDIVKIIGIHYTSIKKTKLCR
ncbi:MAG: hypothetical protein ABIJ97_03020 [Bacteroidota bacterium]